MIPVTGSLNERVVVDLGMQFLRNESDQILSVLESLYFPKLENLAMITKPAHEIEIKVPYGDIDWLGHVNNAKYLTYFETARAELMFRTFGKEEGKKWLDVIIARAEIDFRAAAMWNDVLIVKVRPVSIGNSSWTYEYEIELLEGKHGRGKLIAQGKTVQVAYDYKLKKSVPIPSSFRKLLINQIEETRDN